MRIRLLGAWVGLVLVAAACTSSETVAPPTTPVSAQSSSGTSKSTTKTNDTKPSSPDDPKPTETKRNKDAKPYGETLKLSLDDIQDWWVTTFPKVYDGKKYEPIPSSSIYAATEKKPAPSCSKKGGLGTYEEIKGNAFFCSLGNFVAFDDQELMPQIYKEFGEYAIAMILAHEWGHAIQYQAGIFGTGLPTIVTENQADCFAGAWTKHALDNKSGGFRASPADLQSALGGMLKFSDQTGTDIRDKSAHGSGFDRVNGFQTGFDEGAEGCKSFVNKLPGDFFASQFTSQTDLNNGGNAPYEDAIEIATSDLNAYWVHLGKTYDFAFIKVDAIQRFSADTNMPKCGKKQYSEEEALGTVFFCVDDNYVAWDEGMMQDVVTEIGDFGLGVLLGKQWAISAQVQSSQSKDQIESKTGVTQQSCFTGAWTRAVYDGDAHNLIEEVDPTTKQKTGKMVPAVTLSPGDLDEAILAFLHFSATPDSKGKASGGSAFENVKAFRDGFFAKNGETVCAAYTAPDSTTATTRK